ncbi:MAG: glycosyltransferase, partial [Deltaproteobacteria bacterium]|nr:glycosyltransferase [Deltaproteobacteria bacterium]
MKIVQIDTYDITGGAARAAYRLHKALRENGLDCRTVVKNKVSEDDSVLLATVRKTAEQSDQEFFIKEVVQGHYINYHRTQLSNTMFSVPYPGYDVSGIPAVRQADVINLQWVADFQSPKTIKMLLDSGKPVVWTLHDQWAFTGGCHYSAGCENYQEGCLNCPQLSDDPYDLPAAILKDKLEYFNGMDLTIVTPSRWMARCAGKSRLFADSRIEVISNSLETDLFVPVPKARAKKEIGFDIDSVIILFGAEYGNEKRKGFKELMSAIRHCRTNPGFEKMVRTDKVKIVCFGYPNDELEKIGVPVVPLGYLKSDVEISRAYAAADIFIQPSLEDNLPNTMLESMSCGTPVVAFDVGGMPDMVVENETGRLAPLGDVRLMGEAILSLVFDPDKRKYMSEICRKNILEKYSLDVQARNYLALYDDLHKNYRSTSPVPPERPGMKNFANGRPEQSDLLFVEMGLGRNFQMIIDPVLKKALKELLSIYRERLEKSEKDREKRGEKINDLVRHFNESEKNNKKRLDLIRELNKSLKEKDGLIGELDDSLKKRAGLIEELNDSL